MATYYEHELARWEGEGGSARIRPETPQRIRQSAVEQPKERGRRGTGPSTERRRPARDIRSKSYGGSR